MKPSSLWRLRLPREDGFVLQRPSRDAMFQGHAIQKFHGDERLVTVLADFVDGTNIGMVESGRRPSLPAKALQGLRVFREFIGQELEGDEAAKFGVLSLVDHAHPSATEFFDDAIVRDGLADHFWAIISERSFGRCRSFRTLHLTDATAASQRITIRRALVITKNAGSYQSWSM